MARKLEGSYGVPESPLYTYSDVLHDDVCHDAQVVVVEVLHGFLDDV